MFQEAYLSVCSGAKAKAGLLKTIRWDFCIFHDGRFIHCFWRIYQHWNFRTVFEAGDPMQKVMNSASFAVALSFCTDVRCRTLQEAISYWEQQDSAGSLDGERS